MLQTHQHNFSVNLFTEQWTSTADSHYNELGHDGKMNRKLRVARKVYFGDVIRNMIAILASSAPTAEHDGTTS